MDDFTRFNMAVIEFEKIFGQNELKKIKTKSYKKGNILYGVDKAPLSVIIKRGSAKLSIVENGREFIIFYVQKNNFMIINSTVALEFLESSEIFDISSHIECLLKNDEFFKAYNRAIYNIIYAQRRIIEELLFDDVKGKTR